MAKDKSSYICRECGYVVAKWMGKCPNCDSWNSIDEKAPVAKTTGASVALSKCFDSSRLLTIGQIPSGREKRVCTGISELDRTLGGGVVRGSAVLAGGEPGIGKSTLFLQAAEALTEKGKTLYVSGEESAEQVKLRCDRLGIADGLYFLAETELSEILAAAESLSANFLIVDSIQTIYRDGNSSAPGSVGQVRECAAALVNYAKHSGTAVFLIGHVTKEGAIAGPRLLEHIVDTVLYFEGERSSSFRILRAVKNRFGSTNEIGVFEMRETGMCEVPNPSELLLGSSRDAAGSVIYPAIEGTRAVMTEVESLVCESSFGTPRRLATGVDPYRVSLIIAVLEKKIGLKLYNQDVFVNSSGGIRLVEPGADLAIATAIVSGFRNRQVRSGTVFMGEVGLTGELRHISQVEKRVAEAERMGFERIVLPERTVKMVTSTKLKLVGARSLGDALANMF